MKHTEVDHRGPERQELAEIRFEIEPMLEIILEMLHQAEIVKPGQQWTIELETDCGFQARLIFQVDSFGQCSPYPNPPGRN